MKKQYKPGQRIRRMLPCPDYDYTALEGWLEDMAREGLHMTRDGLSIWKGIFEYGEPQNVAYRLEAVQDTSMSEPDPEQLEIGEKYGWEYVASIKDFFVYRSTDPSAREMNTDPAVQALALSAVKKRMGLRLIFYIGWPLFYMFYSFSRHNPFELQSFLDVGTIYWVIFYMMLLLTCIIGIRRNIASFIYMKNIQKSLLQAESVPDKEGWRKRTRGYRREICVMLASLIYLVWIVIHFFFFQPGRIPLDSYQSTLPFANLQDLLGEEYGAYSPHTPPKYVNPLESYYVNPENALSAVVGDKPNTLWEKGDLLAPCIMEYSECAKFTKSDGTSLKVGMVIEYYHMRSPELAKKLVVELCQDWPFSMTTEAADEGELYVRTWGWDDYFAIIRKGDVVLWARCCQDPEEAGLTLEAWAQSLCDSLGE